MRAIVTGGLGFIGGHLSERLIADGVGVHVIDSRTEGGYLATGASLTRSAVIDASYPPADVIFHLAGPVGPVYLMRKGGSLALEVIESAAVMRDVALAHGIPLVFASTSEVYGEQPQPMDESRPRIIPPGHSPRMEYPVAKLAAELLLLNSPGLDVRIVRPFNVAGPRQDGSLGFVLPRLIEQARRGERLTVYQPGTQRRAFTHIADLVDGIVRAWRNGYAGGVWNLGNPACEASMLDIARMVVEATGSTSEIDIVDPNALWGPDFREAPDKIPDIAKARLELGWNPTRSLSQVIEDAAGFRAVAA